MCEELTLNSLNCYQLPEYVQYFNIETIQGSHKIFVKGTYKYSTLDSFKIQDIFKWAFKIPLVTNVL